MTQGTIALLASALLHAGWNALLKRERDPEAAVLGVLSVALVAAVAAALAWPGPAFPEPASLAWSVAAGLCEGAYFVTLAAALGRASFGAVYAIARGGALVVVWPAATLLLGQPATPRGGAGALLVGLGVALVGLAGRQGPSDRPGRPGGGSGLAWAAACGVCVAGYHLCYDRALALGGAPPPVFAVALATALPLVAATRRRAALAPASWSGRGRQALAGLLCTASFLLFLVGLAQAGAGPALTLRNTAVVFAQALAWAMGEPVPRRQLGGAALVAAGATLLAWP
jgi:drug/metabolite transporter (DMT)-like permease